MKLRNLKIMSFLMTLIFAINTTHICVAMPSDASQITLDQLAAIEGELNQLSNILSTNRSFNNNQKTYFTLKNIIAQNNNLFNNVNMTPLHTQHPTFSLPFDIYIKDMQQAIDQAKQRIQHQERQRQEQEQARQQQEQARQQQEQARIQREQE
ncbi:hypothetical protein GF322_00445, partial [Candidatus Dependentiae bacterium]|nr:hypothetical protein [Candidatus Dependentiae bacterium]